MQIMHQQTQALCQAQGRYTNLKTFGILLTVGASTILVEYSIIFFLNYTIARPLWLFGLFPLTASFLVLTLAIHHLRLSNTSVLTILCLFPVSFRIYSNYLAIGTIGAKRIFLAITIVGVIFFFLIRLLRNKYKWLITDNNRFFVWGAGLTLSCSLSLILQEIQLRLHNPFPSLALGFLLYLGILLIIFLSISLSARVKTALRICFLTSLIIAWGYAYASSNPSFFMSNIPHQLTPDLAATLGSLSEISRPNIIVISLDTVRASNCSLYGYAQPTTPAMAQWAEQQATVYSRGIAPSTWTFPSHVSIFSGLFPSEHQIVNFITPEGQRFIPAVPDEMQLFPELLQASGYYTAGVAANYVYFSREWNITKGFNRFNSPPQTFCSITPLITTLATTFFASTKNHLMPYVTAETITDEAIAILDAPQTQPFFLFINYMDAHDPNWPPAEYRNLFLEQALARRPHRPLANEAFITSQQRLSLALYDSSLRYIDTQLERILNHPLADNSLIVIFGDHGELFGEHGLVNHCTTPYDNLVWVPFLVHHPGQNSGQVLTQPVSLIEIYNEIIVASKLDEVIPTKSNLPALSQIFHHPDHGSAASAVYSENWKLLSHWQGESQLFNYLEDPTEDIDRIEQLPATAADLAMISNEYQITPPVSNYQLEPDLARRLRGLGYLN